MRRSCQAFVDGRTVAEAADLTLQLALRRRVVRRRRRQRERGELVVEPAQGAAVVDGQALDELGLVLLRRTASAARCRPRLAQLRRRARRRRRGRRRRLALGDVGEREVVGARAGAEELLLAGLIGASASSESRTHSEIGVRLLRVARGGELRHELLLDRAGVCGGVRPMSESSARSAAPSCSR